jgi:glycosyltransferase involved in cell wall biosynthesis
MKEKLKQMYRKAHTAYLVKKIKDNVRERPYSQNARFDSTGLESTSGVHNLSSDQGNTGLVVVTHTPSENAYRRLVSFTEVGGKMIYLPMYAGIPLPYETPMYSIIGYSTLSPARHILSSKTINLTITDFLPIGRFKPMLDVEKIYDFLIVTWAGDIKHKRWDLVVDLIRKLCPVHNLCVVAYSGKPSKRDMEVISEYVKTGNLTCINTLVTKEEFPKLLNSSKVLVVPSEWDCHPRIMDQALLCDIPLAVNVNIYGGANLVNHSTGILSHPDELAQGALTVLEKLAGKVNTRKWYLENHGPYNATIKLTNLINEVFSTEFKIVYKEDSEFMFKQDYMKQVGIPPRLYNYFKDLI